MRQQAEVITRTDTLTLRDTIRETYPVYVTNTETDTMLVAVTDTVTVSDTVYLVLDREQRHYRGDGYDAWVSGYRPQLDSMWVYPETRYITKEVTVSEKRKRWGIGVQAGYGMSVPGGEACVFPLCRGRHQLRPHQVLNSTVLSSSGTETASFSTL